MTVIRVKTYELEYVNPQKNADKYYNVIAEKNGNCFYVYAEYGRNGATPQRTVQKSFIIQSGNTAAIKNAASKAHTFFVSMAQKKLDKGYAPKRSIGYLYKPFDLSGITPVAATEKQLMLPDTPTDNLAALCL